MVGLRESSSEELVWYTEETPIMEEQQAIAEGIREGGGDRTREE